MERHRQLWAYTAVDAEFFEPYARHPIAPDDFADMVGRQLPAGWTLQRSGPWLQAQPPACRLPVQGWKIHVASVAATARIVLAITTAILVANDVAFKFAGDLRLLGAINGKRWPRGGAGKFVTVYPADLRMFHRILDDLAEALGGYVGPHVLTDRRHPHCPIVSYRYGGMLSDYRVDGRGRREWLLRRPDGGTEPDDREPRYRVPDWLADPLGSEAGGDGDAPLLCRGRFRPLGALAFSAAGGVYIADDLYEGRRVVIKEARHYIGAAEPATASLRKEFRLLRRLAPHGVAPRPIAYFREWEHSFLAEELLEGETLRLWLGRRYPALRIEPSRADVAAYFDDLCRVFESFAAALDRVHGAGISVGDLSFHNIIVDAAGSVRLIDLETAVEHDFDTVANAWTPGFASRHASRSTHGSAVASDRYAFGANLFAACAPVNALLALDAGALSRFLAQFVEDLGYPQAYADMVVALTHPDPLRRPDPVKAMATLREAVVAMPRDTQPVPHRARPGVPAPGTGERVLAYLEHQALAPRHDRFVPAGPEIFESHPYGVAHGAAGVLHAYQRLGMRAPSNLLPWLCSGVRGQRELGGGLMGGAGGIAWTLFDACESDLAMTLLRGTPLEGAVREDPGLDDGIAGWGMARLKAWLATAERSCLAAACEAGALLLARAEVSNGLLHWPVGERQPLGLGYGASGIALFMLHLHLATGEERYLDASRRALDFDLAQAVPGIDGTSSWPAWVGSGTVLPYLREGTAGVLAVAARLYACTGDARYRQAIVATERDLFRRHAIRPGVFDGLAGLGETLLDLAVFVPDRAALYMDHARSVACGIEPFLLPRDQGFAVPGAELARVSCDLATGNAGVGSFLLRLTQGGAASFMLDEAMPAATQSRCVAA
ncbi:class III lanthionine synthetase LanKC [Luteibacter aegosomatissinici]|uniref:class III lanthionine synthetase LanKC n=1 Tax=Luteibacter aegosomatissinici TaxID=2911539 RepID=UPI001FFAF36C|nr:class III lanthionine synthetase LanKC [Luteibacter aegosomatissinici]UPG94678.1 class III lanthionine synthetase LanKC [Luteibacter aegosomatissinici]